MAESYTITVGWEGNVVGSDGEQSYTLDELGYTNEEWDALDVKVQDRIVEEIAETEFWNQGFGWYGRVDRG